MVLTPSNMLPLGSHAPEFALPDTVTDKIITLDDIKSDIATVIMFICNHCPFVVHIEDALVQFATEYQSKGIQFVAISANDAEAYPADAPELMKVRAQKLKFTFPYLYDETQEVAKAYRAACTPDFYIFDKDLCCVYRGQFDEARPNNDIPVTGQDMRHALDQLIAGKPVNPAQKPSIGCNIKWKSAA